MKDRTQHLVIIVLIIFATSLAVQVSAQSCTSDGLDFLDGLFDSFDFDFSDDPEREPRLRTENTEVTYGLNMMIPVQYAGEEFLPFGFEMGFLSSLTKVPQVSIGVTTSYHNYGSFKKDTLIDDYERIVSNLNIYGLKLERAISFSEYG